MTANVYVDFLRRWYWLLALGALIALGVTRYVVLQRQPLYSATATVQIGRAYQDRNPEPGQLQLTDQLLPIYAELAKREYVLAAAAKTLGPSVSAAAIRSRMAVTTVPRTPLIDITVIDTNPQSAAVIANEVARQLVLQSPENGPPSDDTQVFIQSQVTSLKAKITQGEATIADLERQIDGMTSAVEIQEARQRMLALQTQVDGWQESFSKIVTVMEPSKTNVITVVNPARPAVFPIRRPTQLYYGLGGVIGVGLSTLLALALQFLGRAVQKPDDLGAIVGNLPLLAVPRFRPVRGRGVIVSEAPDSAAAAAYRVLRNTLQARETQGAGGKIAITSSRTGEGKTTTISNLALALANTGRRVVLVDANPRNPELDQRFGVRPYPGFSDLLRGETTASEALQPTEHPNLRIVAAGSLTARYDDLLSLVTVDEALTALTGAAEIVLFDAPALAEEQDAVLLAQRVDGVLLVAEAGRVQVSTVAHSLRLLQEVGVTVAGVVVNKVRWPQPGARRLPWSREARHRARSQQRRLAHGAAESTRLAGD